MDSCLEWKTNVSALCLIVFDASQQTHTGTILNYILAKRKNNMNRQVKFLIGWSKHKIGFHTDINKLYDIVQLRQKDCCLLCSIMFDRKI